MPCCAGSACDECARNGILDCEGSRWPVCDDVANPEELIPYRLFRDKVDKFSNQSGYSKATPTPPTQLHLSAKPTLQDIVLPDPADVNFKFDALVGHRAYTGVKVEPPNLNFTRSTSNNDSPGFSSQVTPGSPVTDSPRGTSPPRQHLPPHIPTSTPPRSPGTPTSSPRRSRSTSKRTRSPGTPYSHRDTPTPTTSPEHLKRPLIDTSVPPPMATMYTGVPGPTLLPPGHVLAPSYYPPPPQQLAPPHYHQPTILNPTEDPLAAFEAAMRKLDSKKASRGRLGPSSPPRAYRVDRPRSRSRERYRDYRERNYSPRRRSPGSHRSYSPRRGISPRRGDRGSGSPISAGDSRNSLIGERRTASPGAGRDYRGDSHGSSVSRQRRARCVADIPPETEGERRERERFERELAERERHEKEKERDDQYSNYKRVERRKGRIAPTPPRDFTDRERAPEHRGKDVDNRTPSLSPEPGTDHHKEYVRRQGEKQREDMRDIDVRNKEEVRYKDERESNVRDDDREYNKENLEGEKDHERLREGDLRLTEREGNRTRDERVKERKSPRHDRDYDRSRDGVEREMVRHDQADWNRREESREIEYKSRDRPHRSPDTRDRSREGYRPDQSVDHKDERNGHKSISKDGEDEHGQRQNKELKKEKKAKKAKKKNKKKDRDSDDEAKDSKKKKKKSKKKKDRDSESHDEQKPENEIKPLVPYGEVEDVKTYEGSVNHEETPPVDPTKFINSLSEAKVEDTK